GFAGRGEMGMPPDDAILGLLEEALHALGSAHDALRTRLLARLAGQAPHVHSLATRDALSHEAVALARRDGAPATLVGALGARYWALLGPDHVDERLAVGTEMLALAERTGDPSAAFVGREVRLGSFLAYGDGAAIDAEIAALTSIAEALRQPAERWF